MLRVGEQVARTDTGRQRRSNEDAYFARAPLFVVADGMGGAKAGEVASSLAAEVFEGLEISTEPEKQLAEAAKEANHRIWEFANQDPGRIGMGTTLTGAFVGSEDVSIVHVGDSRAYRYRNGNLELLTRDHSLVEELKRRGQITESEAKHHPQRSIITRALGPESEVEIDTQTHSSRDGDIYLLCSDGLTTMVSDDEIHSLLAAAQSLQQAVTSLVSAANRAGGKDNITVVAFRVVEAGAGAGKNLAEAVSVDSGESSATAVIDRASAEKARTTAVVSEAALPTKRKRLRLTLKLAAALAALAALAVALDLGLRQLYFIGTDGHGLITVYQGLPYELVGDADLYSTEFVSAVPAADLKPLQRRRVLDHKLRSQADVFSLIRSLEKQAVSE